MTSNGELQRINPQGLRQPSQWEPAQFYSQVVVTPPGSKLAFVSGQVGPDEDGGFKTGHVAQMRQAFQNLRIALQAAGARPEDVAQVTILVADYREELLEPLAEENAKLWGDRKPASTMIPVERLGVDELKFEINAIVLVPA